MRGCRLHHPSSKLPGLPIAVTALKRCQGLGFGRTAIWQSWILCKYTRLCRRSESQNSRIAVEPVAALASSSLSAAIAERTVALPIDFYEILGARTQDTSDSILRAYESRLHSSPGEGFSQAALAVRQEILRGAYQTLADPALRKDYNRSLIEDETGTITIHVPFSKVPGVLCLLQEMGEMQVVLQVGQKLLQERLTRVYRMDIVLAMALAYVELSREAMSKSPPAVIESCEFLETSLKLLQGECGINFSSELQKQIEETLQQMKPHYMLELLALPLEKKYELKREAGIEGTKKILWRTGEGGSFASIPGFARKEFMNKAFAQLTAAELVALFTATPSNIPAESSEVYAVASAYVAEGFMRRKPYLIEEADSLFSELQQANVMLDLPEDSSLEVHKLDYALERGMCALLLGNIETCHGWLGLDDPKSVYRDAYVLEFITDAAEDYLPGICKLLECWLRQVILQGFREMKDSQVNLKQYFDDPTVFNYLENLDRARSPVVAGAAITKLRDSAGTALNNVKLSAFETLQKILPLKQSSGTCDFDNGIADSIPEQKVLQKETTKLDDKYFRDTGHNCDTLAKGNEFPTSKEVLAVKIACISIFTGILVYCGRKVQVSSMSSPAKVQSMKTPNSAASPGSVTSKHVVLLPLDKQTAEELIRKWQFLKSKALGRKHEVDKLSEVLDGKMLDSWNRRGRDVQKNGWYWEYNLTNLSIDSINLNQDGSRAIVEATLWEDAYLHDEKKQKITDSYHTSYNTQYELAVINNRWKIVAGAVVRT